MYRSLYTQFDWERWTSRLETPWNQTFILRDACLKVSLSSILKFLKKIRGTYAGLAHPAAIKHIKSLGITAVELMPIHHFHESPGYLASKGLSNYWGYDSLNYFSTPFKLQLSG